MFLLEEKEYLGRHYESIKSYLTEALKKAGLNDLPSFDEVYGILEVWEGQLNTIHRKKNMSSRKKEELKNGSDDKGIFYLQHLLKPELIRLNKEHPQDGKMSLNEAGKIFADEKFLDLKYRGWKKRLEIREKMLYPELLYFSVYLRMRPEDRKILGDIKFPRRGVYAPTIKSIKYTIKFLLKCERSLKTDPTMADVVKIPLEYIHEVITDKTELLAEYESPPQSYPWRVTDMTVIVWSANQIYQILVDLGYLYQKNLLELIKIFCELNGYHVTREVIKKWIQTMASKKNDKTA